MAQEQIYSDILSGHRERMLNLKKYYPFFRLCENNFLQFRDGKYQVLDMGYIVMAILRFFIEENNFKEKDVTYPEYLGFMQKLIKKDFGLSLSDEEYREAADYIFDKIKNDGKPFTFEYYDPQERTKRVLRTKLIESRIQDSTVWYSISSDGVEFYLDTKEVRDESRISVQQLLLEKLIASRNFRGGTEVVEKINNEVAMLMVRKNEVLSMLSTDVFAGVEAYRQFVETGMRWFDDEQRLFVRNRELIESVYAKAERERDNSEKYYENLREIYKLDTQLKIAMNRHAELLTACTELKVMADEIIRKAKIRRLRGGIDFSRILENMVKNENMALLEMMVKGLLHLNVKKQFNLINLDDMLTYRPDKIETAEKIVEEKTFEIVYEDELEEQRVRQNLRIFMEQLLELLQQQDKFDLHEFSSCLSARFGGDILRNGDFYTFLVHLCHKKEYRFDGEAPDTFLDEIIGDIKQEKLISFNIITAGEGAAEELVVCGNHLTNIRFERI